MNEQRPSMPQAPRPVLNPSQPHPAHPIQPPHAHPAPPRAAQLHPQAPAIRPPAAPSGLPKVGALPQHKAEEIELDPIGLVEEEISAEPSAKKIQAFGIVGMGKQHEWKRKSSANGTGACRVRTFHGKLSDQGMQYIDDAINEWLDAHPEIEVKFVTSSIGQFEGKIREPALVLNLWY